MLSTGEIKSKLIGTPMPYVFIDSVTLGGKATLRSNQIKTVSPELPQFSENEFGTKILLGDKEEDFPPGSEAFSAVLTLSMNDILKKSVWYNTPAGNLIKIKILYATSEAAYDYLNTSSTTSASDAPQNLRKFIDERVVVMPRRRKLKDYAVSEIKDFDDILCTIKVKESFVIKGNFLGFVVFPYVEEVGLVGNRVSQKVLDGQKTDFVSYNFYSEDGSLWTGPVHQHPTKGFMEGATHTNRPHQTLTAVQKLIKLKTRIFDKLVPCSKK